tara:strand:- start:210 stop:1250 length:1041 start_codon:yes stop_codon:yes gene_type:complete
MVLRKLGNSKLIVSSIGIGSQFWGGNQDLKESYRQLDYAFDHGINFIDTAEIYPVPYSKKTWGGSEKIIGSWLKKKKLRSKAIIATKIAGRSKEFPYIRKGNLTLDKKNIRKFTDESLKRLNTDYLDLVQIHWPDRSTNFFGQLEYNHIKNEKSIEIKETLFALKEQVKAGKIREIGVCNETPWGLSRYLKESEMYNLPKISSIQHPYNLLNRNFEISHSEISIRENVSLICYSPLAHGSLTGKYRNGIIPKNSRYKKYPFFKRYKNNRCIEASNFYIDLADKYNINPAQSALAFILTKPFVSSVLISVSNVRQLALNIEATNISLSKNFINEINSYHKLNPNPSH